MNFVYGQKIEYYDKQAENTMKKITAKTLYQLNTTTFTPPAIVFKRFCGLVLGLGQSWVHHGGAQGQGGALSDREQPVSYTGKIVEN